MPLSYNELTELVDNGVITNVTPDRINAASIDVTLYDTIWVESNLSTKRIIDLAAKPREFPEYVIRTIKDSYPLRPNDFILAATNETFNLPDDICAEYRLNSSLARAGLNAALAMWCLTGNTEIPLLDGTTQPIEQLAGKQAWVYSTDVDGKTVPGFASRIWRTKEATELTRIVFDDGTMICCTPEHLIRLRNGSWIAASELARGTTVMSIPRKPNSHNINYETVYSPSGYRRKWVPTHEMVDRRMNGKLPKGYVVHHIDHNPTNNTPDNLIRMTLNDHLQHHHEALSPERLATLRAYRSNKAKINNAQRWANPENRLAMSEKAKAQGAGTRLRSFVDANKEEWRVKTLTGQVRIATDKLIALGMPITPDSYISVKRQNAPTIKTLGGVFGSFEQAVKAAEYENHVVISVDTIQLNQPVSVYDMTVDEHHNFVLNNGVVAHNCDCGWNSSQLTLELKNWTSLHTLLLRPGMKIGQMIFHRVKPVPTERSYRVLGSYNGTQQGPSVR